MERAHQKDTTFYLPCGHYACKCCAPYSHFILFRRHQSSNIDEYTFEGHRCLSNLCMIDARHGQYSRDRVPEERCPHCTAIINFTDLAEVNKYGVSDWMFCFFAFKAYSLRNLRRRAKNNNNNNNNNNNYAKKYYASSDDDDYNNDDDVDDDDVRPILPDCTTTQLHPTGRERAAPGASNDSYIWNLMREVARAYKSGHLPSIENAAREFDEKRVDYQSDQHARDLYRYTKTIYSIAERLREPALLGLGFTPLPALNVLLLGDASKYETDNLYDYSDYTDINWVGSNEHLLYSDFDVDLSWLLEDSELFLLLSDEWKLYARNQLLRRIWGDPFNRKGVHRSLYTAITINTPHSWKTASVLHPFLAVFLIQYSNEYSHISKVLGQHRRLASCPQVVMPMVQRCMDLIDQDLMDYHSLYRFSPGYYQHQTTYKCFKTCLYAITFAKRQMLTNLPAYNELYLTRFARFTVSFFMQSCVLFAEMLQSESTLTEMLMNLPCKRLECKRVCRKDSCQECFTMVPHVFSSSDSILHLSSIGKLSDASKASLLALWGHLHESRPERGLTTLMFDM